jgi:hypothetical protein
VRSGLVVDWSHLAVDSTADLCALPVSEKLLRLLPKMFWVSTYTLSKSYVF